MISVRNSFWPFLIIFVVNLILKLIFIDYYPLSYDESVSMKNTLLDFGHIKHEAEWDNNPPFFYYCLWVWHTIFPLTGIFARLLSLLFVTLAISINYTIVRKQLGEITAIAVSVFLIASSFLTLYSHEARAYSLVVLLSVTSTSLLFSFIESKKTVHLLAFSLCNFLLLYTHYITALFIFSQFIFLLFKQKKLVIKITATQAVVIILLVLLRFTKKQFQNIVGFNKGGDFWLQKADLQTLMDSLSEMYFPAYLFLPVLAVAVFLFFRKSKKTNDYLLYTLLCGLFPIIILFLVGTQKAVFLSRYIIFTIPFLITFILGVISNFTKAGWVFSTAIVLLSLTSFTLKPKKGQDYRMIAQVIRHNYSKDDFIFVNTADNLNLFQYYFDYNGFLQKNRDSSLRVHRIFGISDTNSIKQINLQNCRRVYLVQSFHKKTNGRNELQEYLKNKFPAFEQRIFLGAELSTFSR